MRRLFRLWMFTLFGVLLLPAGAYACECAGPAEACHAVWDADAVFVGHVISISTDMQDRVAEVAVNEPFRGIQLTQVRLSAGFGGLSCGYEFEMGKTYLIYASRSPEGHLATSACSRTRPVEEAAGDLAYLRSLAAVTPRTLGRLAGTIHRWQDPPPSDYRFEGLPNIRVRATGDGRTFTGVSNGRGEFLLTRLPLGTYEVQALLPDGLAAETLTETLHDAQGCEPLHFYVRNDSRISGRVTDGRGRGVPGLAIDLVLSDEIDRSDYARQHVEGRTGNDGTFEIGLIAPGTYALKIIGGDRADASVSAVLYPERSRKDGATTIVLEARKRLTLAEFVIPEALSLVTIRGVVVDDAGRPVKGAEVTPLTRVPPNTSLGPSLTTDGEGQFVFSLFENSTYEVSASRTAAGSDSRIEMATVQGTATPAATELRIILQPAPYR
ncbi:MAG: carboxypeptidase regulatory-like domain-containing protein [Vicinamibacterales bacterium]